MDGRPTSEIVADLCRYEPHSIFAKRAADRLVELDVESRAAITEQTLKAERLQHLLLERPDNALRPPCPTCGGSTDVLLAPDKYGNTPTDNCPDCVDGKASIQWMAAVFNAVHDDEWCKAYGLPRWTINDLRGIR